MDEKMYEIGLSGAAVYEKWEMQVKAGERAFAQAPAMFDEGAVSASFRHYAAAHLVTTAETTLAFPEELEREM